MLITRSRTATNVLVNMSAPMNFEVRITDDSCTPRPIGVKLIIKDSPENIDINAQAVNGAVKLNALNAK